MLVLPNSINKEVWKVLDYVTLDSTLDPLLQHVPVQSHIHLNCRSKVLEAVFHAYQHCPSCLQGLSSALSELLHASLSRLILCKSLLPTPWKKWN